jgi:uncharacterized membrane protein/thiol-disulfide isomerase/thioredoxin
MSRRRSTPWIHRWSRVLIGAIAIIGALTTGYLTLTHFQGQSVACPTSGCDSVLSSQYANIRGLPLSLFGTLAYSAMAILSLGPLAVNATENKELRKKLEESTWLLLLIGAVSMVVFSGYLMYLLFFKINAGICVYCLASATFTVAMLILTLVGREWPDLGQVFFTGIIVAVVAGLGTLIMYADITGKTVPSANGSPELLPITTNSGPAEISLAEHLKKVDAKMYGAYWCPHCHDQKQLFGQQAFAKVPYIECDSNGPNAQPDLCKAAKIEGFPTWKIKDKSLSGAQALTELAKVSAYSGPQNFKNVAEGSVAPSVGSPK